MPFWHILLSQHKWLYFQKFENLSEIACRFSFEWLVNYIKALQVFIYLEDGACYI